MKISKNILSENTPKCSYVHSRYSLKSVVRKMVPGCKLACISERIVHCFKTNYPVNVGQKTLGAISRTNCPIFQDVILYRVSGDGDEDRGLIRKTCKKIRRSIFIFRYILSIIIFLFTFLYFWLALQVFL